MVHVHEPKTLDNKIRRIHSTFCNDTLKYFIIYKKSIVVAHTCNTYNFGALNLWDP